MLRATAIALTLLSLANLASAATEDLFNGKDLDGWRAYLVTHSAGLSDVFTVRDGAIVCKGDPMGYLYTTKAYRNFRLRVEYRWAPGQEPGNSGLFLRLNAKPGFLPRTMECQLKSGNAGDLYAFEGMPITGDAARFQVIEHKELGKLLGVKATGYNENKPGEWNVVEVTVDGPAITVAVNGKPVNEAAGAEVLAGPIGLQSEGGEVHFRKVQVTPLPD